jgi:hypothetical protein
VSGPRLSIVALGALLLSACEGSREAGDVVACFSIQDCADGEVCFFGRCAAVGFRVDAVFAEITPPNDSPYLVQQYPSALSLGDLEELFLEDSVVLSGRILAPDWPVPGESLSGTLLARAEQVVIPGREIVRRALVGPSGFSLPTLPGVHHLTFEPDGLLRPPAEYPDRTVAADLNNDYPYDAVADMVVVHGRVRRSATEPHWVAGARVRGIGRSVGQPEAQLRSSVAETGLDGTFTLLFPRDTNELSLTVGPGTTRLVPEATFTGFRDVVSPHDVGDLVLGFATQPVEVDALVLDEASFRVANAEVLFDGFAVGEAQGRFAISGTSDPNGNLTLSLLPGDYRVTVAPPKSRPYALSSQVESIVADGVVTITLRSKVTVSGNVVGGDGRAVTDAEVVLTRQDAPVSRVFKTQVGADGRFSIEVDPGDYDEDNALVPAEYELLVQPTIGPDLPVLPRYRRLVQVYDGPVELPIELYQAELVYGIVRDPTGEPLSDATIAFYSLELADEPVLVGLVQTLSGSAAGEFVLPVPVPPGL